MRRLSKLEATVRQIVDGAASGDAQSIKLLFALIKTDESALAEPETARSRDAAKRWSSPKSCAGSRESGLAPAPPTPHPALSAFSRRREKGGA